MCVGSPYTCFLGLWLKLLSLVLLLMFLLLLLSLLLLSLSFLREGCGGTTPAVGVGDAVAPDGVNLILFGHVGFHF